MKNALRLALALSIAMPITLASLSLYAQDPDCCGAPFNYYFSLSRISDTFLPNARSPQLTDDFPRLGPRCLGDQLSVQVFTPLGFEHRAMADVYLNVISEDLDRLWPSDGREHTQTARDVGSIHSQSDAQ